MASVIERTVKGGAGFFAANVVKRGFGFVFVVVASRILGPAEYGILALGLSVEGLIRNVAAFGLPNTIQRFLSGEGERQVAQLYGAILLTGGVAALSTCVGLYAAAPKVAAIFGESSLTGPLRVLSIGIVTGVGFALARSVLQAQEQVREVFTIDLVRSVAKVGLLLPLFFWVQSATMAAWAVVGAFGVALVGGGICTQELAIRPKFKNLWPSVQKVLSYSAPLVVVGFGYFLAQQADRLMLGWLADASAVGIYTVTSKLAMIMGTLHGALVSIFKPIASEAYRSDKKRQIREAYLFVGKWAGTASGMALLLFTGGGPWLLGIFGVEYTTNTTYHVLVLLSLLYFIGTWIGPAGALLHMSDGHRVELVNTIFFIITNVMLNYVLITTYGVVGAAVATLISGTSQNVLQACQIIYWKNVNPFSYKNVGLLGIVSSGTITIVLIPGSIIRVLVTFSLIFMLIAYILLTSGDEERNVVKKLFYDVSPGFLFSASK